MSNIKIWWRDLDTESSAPRSDAVRHATELYLLWLDEGDGDMPVDPKVRKHYTELAQKHPACSVEEEARAWLHLQVVSMSDAEIRQAVEDAASRMPKTLTWAMYEDKWAAAHKDNISDLIAHKNASN